MESSLTIAGTSVLPGERKDIEIPVASLYMHTQVTLPVKVIRGKSPGPRLFISAAIHGDEILGVEIIRRLNTMAALKKLRGDLILVPVVNVYGFINQSRYLPDRRDLNRCFPGSKKGSLAARLAKLFMEEIVKPSTHGIDLHTGAKNRSNLPQIRVCLNHDETKRLAEAFGAPVIMDSDLRDGSLRQAVYELGRPILLYEAGEALRFDEVSIRAGVQGVLSVMRALDMIKPTRRNTPKLEPFIARSSVWVRANASGILRINAALGARVQKGECLGVISDPFGEIETEVLASESGIIIGRSNLPLVIQGEAIFHIATFDKPRSAKHALEAFQSELDPEMVEGPSGEPAIV